MSKGYWIGSRQFLKGTGMPLLMLNNTVTCLTKFPLAGCDEKSRKWGHQPFGDTAEFALVNFKILQRLLF
jgi:hypothetical protein